MASRLWRFAAVTIASLLLAFFVMDAAAAVFANAGPGFSGQPAHTSPGTIVVRTVTDPHAIAGGTLQPGDRVHLDDLSFMNQMRFLAMRPGDRFALSGATKAGAPLHVVVTMTPYPAPMSVWVELLSGAAFALVGLIVAARRPADPLARMLTALLLSIGVLFVNVVPWLPDLASAGVYVARAFCGVYCAYAGLRLATAFPRSSERGIRRVLERAAPWYTAFSMAFVAVVTVRTLVFLQPIEAWLRVAAIIDTLAFFAGIAVAFAIAIRESRGADLKRVQWVAWTLAAGFSGPLAVNVQIGATIPFAEWEYWIPLTLLAIPLGLGYAIVRHRVVDIGFVVNRALVFGTLSAIVVVAFMVLEWALSSVAMRISHITSTSLELALALVLGFSMRSIHARVDRVVDDLFFRDRHEAERALRMLAREVGYVSEPQVAVARVHAELLVRTAAAFAAVYVADGPLALRIDPSSPPLPDAVDIDDPALVRMRATRVPCALHRLASALAADHAFPLLVRDAVTGFVVLGSKTNGEAFAPDEIATVEAVALALGNALDALQTAALKREIARVLAEGAPLDALRRTVDPALWVRGSLAQPAGSLSGLDE